jgi:hypothetical protein
MESSKTSIFTGASGLPIARPSAWGCSFGVIISKSPTGWDFSTLIRLEWQSKSHNSHCNQYHDQRIPALLLHAFLASLFFDLTHEMFSSMQ